MSSHVILSQVLLEDDLELLLELLLLLLEDVELLEDEAQLLKRLGLLPILFCH